MVRAHHQTDNDDDEPFEGSGSGKAGSESGQNFIHKFQHRMVNRDEIGYTTLVTLSSDLISSLAFGTLRISQNRLIGLFFYSTIFRQKLFTVQYW